MNQQTQKSAFDYTVESFLLYMRSRLTWQVYNYYEHRLAEIKVFLESIGIHAYSADACAKFISTLNGGNYSGMTEREKRMARCANAMLEHMLTGIVSYRTPAPKHALSEAIGKAVEVYISWRALDGASEDTLASHRLYLSRLCIFLLERDVTDVKEITATHVIEYVKSLGFFGKGTAHCAASVLRCFFRYLKDNSIIERDWSYLIAKDGYKRESKLPSVYTALEVERIIGAIDRGSPKGKRDYAIVLLAARLGLRASDICRIEFGSICWDRNLIVLLQAKTRKEIKLPLLPEVGNAIIDYLKYARPRSESPYIFLHHINPFDRLQEPTLHSIIHRLMSCAGISGLESRKHGPHALRHSLAGALLEKKTPLPVISEVLGHAATESTSAYLRIDIDTLRQCVIDVPEIGAADNGGWCAW